jgi:hypothetical protein
MQQADDAVVCESEASTTLQNSTRPRFRRRATLKRLGHVEVETEARQPDMTRSVLLYCEFTEINNGK